MFASPDGAGEVQTLNTGGTMVRGNDGAVIDPATSRIYWMDIVGGETGKVLFANLDGSGGGQLNTAGASTIEPSGMVIDPVGRKIYWPDRLLGRICFANLDGSGGGFLQPAKAQGGLPSGLAIDPVARRLYWVNAGGPMANAVSWMNLDGPGEGSLPIGTAVRNGPSGAAIDPVHRRFYWANINADSISFANLDESGGGNLNTAGATVALATGVAVDPVAGRVYWANQAALGIGGTISFANSDGSGGGRDLVTRRFNAPQYPLLYYSPQPISPPAISGGTGPGSSLTCSTGTWSTDAPEAFFYSTADRFTYQWSRNGTAMPEATGPTHTAGLAGGEFRCQVTALNDAGSKSQASAVHRVTPALGNLVLKLAAKRIRPGAIRVAILNRGQVDVAGSLSGRAKVSARKRSRFAKLATTPFQVPAGARTVVRLQLPKALRLRLLSRRKLPVELSATFAAPGGAEQATRRSLTPRLRSQPR